MCEKMPYQFQPAFTVDLIARNVWNAFAKQRYDIYTADIIE